MISVNSQRRSGTISSLKFRALDNNNYCCKTLPNDLQTFLSTLLTQLKYFSTVTNFSLSLREDEVSKITLKSPRVDAARDILETELSNKDQILPDI